MPARNTALFVAVALSVAAALVASQSAFSASKVVEAEPAPSATAEAIYRDAKPRLLQIRTLLNAASQKSSTGSGFLISADGLAITNYHVVSQHAMEPQTYRMEYVSPDGTKGDLKLLAFDVINDLALIQLDKGGWKYFDFDARALEGNLPRGEKLFSLGNPLDIGFAVMEGNYSGLVERSYNERIHLSGPMNAGMSGGPTLTTNSRIAGVNVAKIAFGAEQVSFLVPVKFAAALVAKQRMSQPITASAVRAEIGTQLAGWQKGLFAALGEKGFKATENGPYLVPESASNWFTCWANTNADEKPKPRARADATNCNMQNWLFVAGDLFIGNVVISRTHFTNQSLNSFQFANFVSDKARFSVDRTNPKRSTAPACHEDIVRAGDGDKEHPPIRLVWCASAYREFEGLYNVSFMAVTQDRIEQSVALTVSMSGTDYDNAVRFAQRMVAELRAKP